MLEKHVIYTASIILGAYIFGKELFMGLTKRYTPIGGGAEFDIGTCLSCVFYNSDSGLCCIDHLHRTPLSHCNIDIINNDPVMDDDTYSNQKAKADDGKPRLSLVPRDIIFAIARIREYGNQKYPDGGPDNWRYVEPERYRDAMFRHLCAYLDDPYGVDDESQLPHLWHLACNVAFLCALDKDKIEEEMGEYIWKD